MVVKVRQYLASIGSFLNKKISVYVLLGFFLLALLPQVYPLLISSYKERLEPGEYRKEALGVGELITQVKSELAQMEQDRRKKGDAALFEVKDFDLEISFVVHKHVSAKGEVSYHLVTVGGEVQSAFERAQKVTLHLTTLPPAPVRGESVPPSQLEGNGKLEQLGPSPPPKERKKP